MTDAIARRDFFKTLACAALAAGVPLPVGFPREWRPYYVAEWFDSITPFDRPMWQDIVRLALRRAAQRDGKEVDWNSLAYSVNFDVEKAAYLVQSTALLR